MHMMLRTLAGCAMLGFALAAPAQNVVITNARIIDGTGNVIEHGSVVAKDGKIVAVASGEPRGGSAGPRLDAHGMTVLAGFIDAHRHIIRGNTAAWLKDPRATQSTRERRDPGPQALCCPYRSPVSARAHRGGPARSLHRSGAHRSGATSRSPCHRTSGHS
jgi:hypothetical protein